MEFSLAKRPALALIMSFAIAVGAGTLLLLLPVATPKDASISFVDALFTATSATCVTGLIVRSTVDGFTLFGKTVILILIQLGGLGLMTFSVALFMTFGKKISKTQELLLQDALNEDNIRSSREILNFLLIFTFAAELVGAIFLFFGFRAFYTPWEACKMAVFHSISAFCNAGFSLLDTSVTMFSGNTFIILVFSFLIIVGGIGFVVLMDLFNYLRKKKKRVKIHTKLAVIMTVILLFAGTLLFYIAEKNNTMANMNSRDKWTNSFFLSVTARTAGFNSVDTTELSPLSKFSAGILMFIGASPGGTGGGVKTVTFAMILLMALSHIRYKENITVYKRNIPPFFGRRAVAIFVYAGFIIIFAAGALLYFENFSFENTLFEAISAFGTVGLSCGLTADMSVPSKYILSVVMFMGRLGPLTIALAAMGRKQQLKITYASERILLG